MHRFLCRALAAGPRKNARRKYAAKLFLTRGLDNIPWEGYIVDTHRGYETKGLTAVSENMDCCAHRTKERTPEEYRSLIHRLNRIEGQVRGIRGMVEKGAYCPEILVQSAAVTAAMNAFSRELLSDHIRTCVVDDIRAGRDETIDELLRTLQKLMR